jgi:(p)ppGpp synthase/HD superfamily hydrolase
VNGYSALHDTYKFPEGNVEFAFTTVNREAFNNWGVVSMPQEVLRTDREKHFRKLIFTPKEELVFMEPGATGIDVAYKLSESLGLRAVAIIIDGRMTDLSEIVPNASMVEIITDQTQDKPKADWFNFCNEETRKILEQQMIIVDHDEEAAKGKQILAEKVLKERGLLSLDDFDKGVVDKLLLNLGCWHGLADLYYKIAYGLDLELVKKRLNEIGVTEGMYSTIEVTGNNRIGVSQEIAEIVADNGGDTRLKIERVGKEERFLVRIIMVVDEKGKQKIREQVETKFGSCLII